MQKFKHRSRAPLFNISNGDVAQCIWNIRFVTEHCEKWREKVLQHIWGIWSALLYSAFRSIMKHFIDGFLLEFDFNFKCTLFSCCWPFLLCCVVDGSTQGLTQVSNHWKLFLWSGHWMKYIHNPAKKCMRFNLNSQKFTLNFYSKKFFFFSL